MKDEIFDVIIVGAGPAGSICAYYLAQNNFNVLLIDKEIFPRYKVCGGGLQSKVLEILPFDIEPVIEQTITKIEFSNFFSECFERTSEMPLMYCTMRDTFDNFLVQKAVENKVKFVQGVHVTNIEESKDYVKVNSENENYKCSFLIGADGANSIVRKSLFKNMKLTKGIALEIEVKLKEGQDSFDGKVFLDWGTLPGGYAWIFPKKNHISIGVGGLQKTTKWLNNYYNKYTENLGLEIESIRSKKAFSLPLNVKKQNIHSKRTLLIGDAAGLVEGFSGEGIYYAIRSGKIAAEIIAEANNRNDFRLGQYSKIINREIIPELRAAKGFRQIFNTFPQFSHRLVKNNNRGWYLIMKVLRGERSFRYAKNRFFLLRLFWPLITLICEQIERRKIEKYSI